MRFDPTEAGSASPWRRQISSHEQFEDLCVIAAAGEISAEEWQQLMTHLAECESCRSVFGDMEEIHAHCVPEGFEVEAGGDPRAETLLRSKVLRRAAREGARFSKPAVKGPNLFHLRPARDPRLPVARF